MMALGSRIEVVALSELLLSAVMDDHTTTTRRLHYRVTMPSRYCSKCGEGCCFPWS